MTVKSWFAKFGIGVVGAASAVGHSMAVNEVSDYKASLEIINNAIENYIDKFCK